MRDFLEALNGVEIPESYLDGHGLKDRAVQAIYKHMSELMARERIRDISLDQEQDWDDYYAMKTKVKDLIKVYWPNVDRDMPNSLVIYPSVDARAKGRSARTHMRLGRALRRMFPVLFDHEVEALVDKLKDELFAREWTVKRGREAEDFRHAYAHARSTDQNMPTTAVKKQLCTSCMRYEFDHLPSHPAEAYASGEFEIIWVEDNKGKIGGRCVVWMGAEYPQPGPIYAVAEEAYSTIYQALPENSVDAYDTDWSGAKLKAIPYQGGFVAPYIDTRTKWLKEVSKDFLEINSRGEIDASCYSGLLGCDLTSCESCGDTVHPDDVYHNINGEGYCSDCYGELYIHCEHCHEDELREESSTVHIQSNWGLSRLRGYVETWCYHCTHDNAVEVTNGEVWRLDDTYEVADNCDRVSIAQIEDGDYFICDWNALAYEIDDLCVIDGGGSVSREAIDHFNETDGNYVYIYNDNTGEYVRTAVDQEAQASA